MSTNEPGVLKLPARVDATVAAALFREWAPRARALEAIDLGAVESIDSAGVALVQELRARGGARLRGAGEAWATICRAHRIDPDGGAGA